MWIYYNISIKYIEEVEGQILNLGVDDKIVEDLTHIIDEKLG